MDDAEQGLEEEPGRSRAAGGCVLFAFGAVVAAAIFAFSAAAGVLTLWVVGTFTLWRAARRMSGSSATPPPEKGHPSCGECTGQGLVGVTPSESQKGMVIYSFALPGRPNHTHIHLSPAPEAESERTS